MENVQEDELIFEKKETKHFFPKLQKEMNEKIFQESNEQSDNVASWKKERPGGENEKRPFTFDSKKNAKKRIKDVFYDNEAQQTNAKVKRELNEDIVNSISREYFNHENYEQLDMQQKYFEIRKALFYMCNLDAKCGTKFFINSYILDEDLFNHYFDRFIIESDIKILLIESFANSSVQKLIIAMMR